MKKFYRIIILLIVLIFLTTYSPSVLNVFPKKKNFFFKIQNIEVINNYLIDENEIIEKLNQIYKKNILFVSRNDIERPLKSIVFLESIEVKKKYPSTIIITVYESKPVAILFKKNSKYLLDSSSNLIPFNENMLFDDLPSLFGEKAEQNFINF
jgi:cell division protein FtsQ